MNRTATVVPSDAEYTLFDLVMVVWRGKWIVALIMTIVLALAIYYALTATKWYRAYAVIMHAEQAGGSPLGGQLSGLAALANVGNFSTGTAGNEALAVLRSREFAAEFIRSNDLLSTFSEVGVEPGKTSNKEFDMREAVRFFHENVLRLSEDGVSGAVTLSVFWTDPEIASKWADELIRQINEKMRQRALREAESNIKFLKAELATSNILPLQQSIGNLLENELQSQMLARSNEDFAFRVIDPPQPPLKRTRPRRSLIVLTAGIVGGVFSVLTVFLISSFRRRRQPQ